MSLTHSIQILNKGCRRCILWPRKHARSGGQVVNKHGGGQSSSTQVNVQCCHTLEQQPHLERQAALTAALLSYSVRSKVGRLRH